MYFYHSQAGGCCDCGDPDAWSSIGEWSVVCMCSVYGVYVFVYIVGDPRITRDKSVWSYHY